MGGSNMASNFEDFLESTQNAANVNDLSALFRNAVADEGYQNIVFAHLSRKKNVEVLSADCPDGYSDMYFSRKYHLLDPILHQTLVARRPFTWDPIVSDRKRSPNERVFFNECRDIGVHGGLTMPFHNPDGSTHVMSVSLRDGPAPDPRRVSFVYALAVLTWSRYCALQADAADAGEHQIRLTARECECLSWAKDGKTNWEISQIISVAERTVEFHIGNAMRKLNASNRITAIVIAIQEGLIGL
jgi:DNA-binding CsgD family transcriptional regulator